MVRILAIIVLVTGVWGNSTAQELSPEIEEIVKLMAEDGLVLRGPYGGRSNKKFRSGCILDSKPVRDHLINMAYPKGDVTLEDIDVNWKRN